MATASELHHTKQSSQHDVSNKRFFDGLIGRAKTAAMLMAEKRAHKMQQILVHRWLLGSSANGRFPRWDGSNNQPSLKSFSKWTVKPSGEQGFILYNNATDADGDRRSAEGFNYPQLLISGKGWNKKTRGSLLLGSKLIRDGSLIFSDQMRRGLNPWLKDQREKLENDIKKQIRSVT